MVKEREGRNPNKWRENLFMAVLNFLIAITALIIAILAYQRSAGSKDLKTQVNSLRKKTADTLAKMEKALRKGGKEDEQSSKDGQSD